MDLTDVDQTWPSIDDLRARRATLGADEREVLAAGEAFVRRVPPDQREALCAVPLRARRLPDGSVDCFPERGRSAGFGQGPGPGGGYPDKDQDEDERPWFEDLHGWQGAQDPGAPPGSSMPESD